MPDILRLDALKLDGGTQPRAEIDQQTVGDYAGAMSENTIFPPIVVFYDGENYWLADGFHRAYAAKQNGAEEIRADIRQGTRRDAVLYSVGANAQHGLRRTNADKRRAVMTLLTDDEWKTWSDRSIAEKCAVDHKTVSAIRDEITGEFPQMERTVERGGTTYTMQTGNIGKQDFYIPSKSDEMDETQGDDTIQLWKPPVVYTPETPPALPPMLGRSTGNYEWYTPAQYVDAARAVMGGIDLDPASCKTANETVKATKFYTQEDDGMLQEWLGRVWMNPPYSQPLMAGFCKKLVSAFVAGDVTQAVVLVNNATETGWFHTLLESALALCIMKGRISFYGPANPEGDAVGLQGQIILYFGKNTPAFAANFSQFGKVLYV